MLPFGGLSLGFSCLTCLIFNANLRNEQRWEAAVQTLKATEATRSKLDRRAKFASLVGLYIDDDDQGKSYGVDLIVAVQPDRSSGRKLIFIDRMTEKLLGFVLLESSNRIHTKDAENVNKDDNINVSTIRGMEVQKEARGRGYSSLFLSLWLKLCLQGNINPATVSINKPLLALTLSRFGFTPSPISTKLDTSLKDEHTKKKKRKRRSIRKTPIDITLELDCQNEGAVHIYCDPSNFKNLEAGFTAGELESQGLVLAQSESQTSRHHRGRSIQIQIRTCYVPPESYDDDVVLYGLRLHSSQGECTFTSERLTNDIVREKASKTLTGRLRGFNNRSAQ